MIKKLAETRCLVRVSSATTGLCPLFSVGSYQKVALPFMSYNKYLDSEDNCFREPTMSLDWFKKRRFMIASAPCNNLEEGFLQIPREIVAGKRYQVTTEVGKKVSTPMLEAPWILDTVCGFCLSDFTSNNIFVTPSGEVRGVQLLKRSPVLVKRNLSSAYTILKDLFSSDGKPPPCDIGRLLDLMKDHPEKREIFHIHASLVPLPNQADLFMRLFGCLFDKIEPVVRDRILEDLPHAETFEMNVQSNLLLKKFFDHSGGGNYVAKKPELKGGETCLTAGQQKWYKWKQARNLCFYLRNRISHRMEHFRSLCRYLADMADLAAHVRFPSVNSYLQEQLFDAGETRDLLLHSLTK